MNILGIPIVYNVREPGGRSRRGPAAASAGRERWPWRSLTQDLETAHDRGDNWGARAESTDRFAAADRSPGMPKPRNPDEKTLAVRVAVQIRTAILAGKYGPSTALTQRLLAADHGPSATPIREALRTLEAEGLVRLEKDANAVVAAVSTLEHRDIMAATLLLETHAALELAAKQGRDLARVEEHQRNLESLVPERSIDEKVEFASQDVEFHCAIAEAADCPNAAVFIRRLRFRSRLVAPIQRQTEKRRREVIEEHGQILEGIKGGDLDRASEASREHVLARARLWFPGDVAYLESLPIFEHPPRKVRASDTGRKK